MDPPKDRLNQAFGKYLREVRRAANLSQEALAAKSRLHPTYISLLERGRRSPSLASIVCLAESLGLRAYELVKGAEEAEESKG